jgi:hypothetical protein
MQRELTEVEYQQVKVAIRYLLQNLPDKNKNRDQEFTNALLAMSGKKTVSVVDMVARMLGIIPRCYGAYRKEKFWKILFEFFSSDEAQQLYLAQFPQELTEAQWHSLRNELGKRFNIPTDTSDSVLQEKFKLRLPNMEPAEAWTHVY